jgi:hypothetical protein
MHGIEKGIGNDQRYTSCNAWDYRVLLLSLGEGNAADRYPRAGRSSDPSDAGSRR